MDHPHFMPHSDYRETFRLAEINDPTCKLVVLTDDGLEILRRALKCARKRQNWIDSEDENGYVTPDDDDWDDISSTLDDLEYQLMSACDYVTLDDINKRVGINDDAPSQSLSVSGTGAPSIQVHDAVVSQVLVQVGTVFPRIVLDDNQTDGKRWDIGTGLSSAAAVGSFYVRSNDSALTVLTCTPAGALKVSGAFGCNGQAPQTAKTIPNGPNDLPTVLSLCEAIAQALIDNGICVR